MPGVCGSRPQDDDHYVPRARRFPSHHVGHLLDATDEDALWLSAKSRKGKYQEDRSDLSSNHSVYVW